MEEKKRLQATGGGRCIVSIHPAAVVEPPLGALEDAISVAFIRERLLTLPNTEKAWEIFGCLDRLLKTHPTWRKHDAGISEALEEKEREAAKQEREYKQQVGEMAARPTSETKIDNFYNQGGTFNDHSGSVFLPYGIANLKTNNNTDE